MFASNFFGIRLPHAEIWVPLCIGISVGGLSLVALRYLRRPSPAPAPQPTPGPPLAIDPPYDPFTQGSASECRRAYRRSGNLVCVNIMPHDTSSPVWQGMVLDRSVGGLGLLVDAEVKVGTLLRVLPTNAPKCTPWMDIEVRACRRSKDGFELGCQFVKPPLWAMMLMFG